MAAPNRYQWLISEPDWSLAALRPDSKKQSSDNRGSTIAPHSGLIGWTNRARTRARRGLFDVIISSADVGYEKPDPRILAEALARLRTSPEETLHVGDSIDDDIEGAKAAGLDALLVDRRGVHAGFSGRTVSDLYGLGRIFL